MSQLPLHSPPTSASSSSQTILDQCQQQHHSPDMEESKLNSSNQPAAKQRQLTPQVQPQVPTHYQLDPDSRQRSSSPVQIDLATGLPATKIKRQYKCNECGHATVNPRAHLRHRVDVHRHKIKIVECPECVYACQYRQKLNRHLRLVHHRAPNQVPRPSPATSDNRRQQQHHQQQPPRLQQQHQRNIQQSMFSPSLSVPDVPPASLLQGLQALRDLQHIFATSLPIFNNVFANQPPATGLNDTSHDEPVDLSYPAELKLLIKNQERTINEFL